MAEPRFVKLWPDSGEKLPMLVVPPKWAPEQEAAALALLRAGSEPKDAKA